MEWNRKQLDEALAQLQATVPQLLAECPSAGAFSRAFRRAAAAIESHAGRHLGYVVRRIDAILASFIVIT